MRLRIEESSKQKYSKKESTSVVSISEDVEIEVKNKGILEVPEGKNVDDLPMSHFEKLVKKHGLSKITKALNNLQVWNKNDDKKLSKWAGNMIDKLTKKYGKDESISVKRFNEGWHNGDAIISFTHNDDLEADLEEFLFDLFSDNPDVFDFDWSDIYTNLYLSCSKDDYDYIKWFIEDWKYKHRDEYDESLKEYYDAQDFDRGTEDMFDYDGSDMYGEIPEDSEYEEDGLYEYELAIPRSSMNEFAEFVADLFGERLEDIKNNDSEHVWVVSVDRSRDEVTVKCVCTEKEFKEIDKWAWR